jgi:hypothetical protein
MGLLYRGVSVALDSAQFGELPPKGASNVATPLFDGNATHNGHLTHGPSEPNAVRAHHIDTGLYGGCYVSLTRSEARAAYFATTAGLEDGWVYVLDEALFQGLGVVAYEFPDPLHPHELEVTVRSADCGAIPQGVVIAKFRVNADGSRIG